MAFTLDQIGQYLTAMELRFDYDKEQALILTWISYEEEKGMVFIRELKDGAIFSLELDPLVDAGDWEFDVEMSHKHIHLLLPQLLYANYQTKIGSWEYDPKDGDIRFTIEIPLDDAPITYKQFQSIIESTKRALKEAFGFKEIITTGKIPQSNYHNELLTELYSIMERYK